MDFPAQLVLVRKKLTLSQADLAKELEISFATINRWENDKAQPSYKKLRKFNEFCAKRGIEFKGGI